MKQKPSITRRDFLKASAATVAVGPFVVSAATLGLGDATAASERVTLGCIGMGGQGTSNMQAFMHDQRVQVLAVCDVDAAHRARALEITGLGKSAAFNDYGDILAREDIDAVSIGTPDHWHAIMTIAAARAGKDIYCEKPLSRTITEGRAIVEAVREHKRVLQTGTWRRSRPACRRACELVRNGYIGELSHVIVYLPVGYEVRGGAYSGPQPEMAIPDGFDYDRWLGPAPPAYYTPGRCHFNFRWIRDYSAGYITDWGAHYYDVAQWGMGFDTTGPAAIEALAKFPPEGDLYDAATEHHIQFSYDNGVKLISDTTTKEGNKWGIHFHGSEGWIYVEATEVEASSPAIARAELKADAIRLYESEDHHGNFIDCVLNRSEPAAPVEIAHRSASVCHLGNIAAILKRPLRWDPQNERFYGDDEANGMLSRPYRDTYSL